MINKPTNKNIKIFKHYFGEMHTLSKNVIKRYRTTKNEDEINKLINNSDQYIKQTIKPIIDDDEFNKLVDDGYELYCSYNELLIALTKIRV